MQLDLNLLTALDALLEEQSVTGAAARLHLSAPAMSRTLGRIRAATGDQILVRTGRLMRPTPRALALREEVRSLVLRSAEVLAPEQELHLDRLRRTFTLRAHDAVTTTLAPLLTQRVAQVAPAVAIRFLGEAANDDADLRRGLIDLEIGSSTLETPDVDHDEAGTEELVGLARSGHPMLEGQVDLERWAASPHVIVSRRGRLRDRTDDQLDAAGLSRTVVASVASTAAAIEIVRATDALLVVPRSVADGLGTGLRVFRPPVDLPPVRIVLTWHRQFSTDRAHQWLRGLTRELLIAAGRRLPPRQTDANESSWAGSIGLPGGAAGRHTVGRL